MSNPSYDLIEGFNFVLSIDEHQMSFKTVSGIVRQVETEVYQEGGLNDRVHVFAKPASSEKILHLEKGVYYGKSHPFYLVGERLTSSLCLNVFDSRGALRKSYTFTGVLVKKWEAGELDAAQSALLIDKFDLSYEDFQVS